MCQACLAAGQSADACEAAFSSGGALGTSGSTVSDERAILYTEQEGNDNWRWNAESSLGTAVVVTYSFATGGEIPSIYSSSKNPYGATSFSAFTSAEQDAFRDAADDFMEVSGVIMVEVASGGDIELYNASGSSAGGWAWIPYVTGSYVSDVDLVIDHSGSYSKGGYGYYLLLHELGHAMGLAHSHQDGGDNYVLTSSLDNTNNTVMSYNYAGSVTDLGYLDEAALQTLYGDSVVSAGWSFAKTASNAIGATGSSGVDTIAAAKAVGAATMNYTIDGLAGNDVITGEAGNDTLYGKLGDDVLNGLGGNDTIVGGSGDETIDAGSGHDRVLAGQRVRFRGRRAWERRHRRS